MNGNSAEPRTVPLRLRTVSLFAAMVLAVFGVVLVQQSASATASGAPTITNITASCTGTGTITVSNAVDGSSVTLKLTYHVPGDSVFHDTNPLQTTVVSLNAGQTTYSYSINVASGYPDNANTLRVEVASTSGADFGSSVNTKSPSFGPCGESSSSTTSSTSSSSTTSSSSSTTTSSTSTGHNPKLSLTVNGCIGGESTALVSGTVTDRTDGVDYSANISPDSAPLPTPVDADGTFSLVAQTTGPHTVTVTGSDGSSVSASVNVPACTSTSTTSSSSTSTTGTSTKTTGTHSSTTQSTGSHSSTTHSKTKSAAPVVTTTKGSIPVAAHTGNIGTDHTFGTRGGLIAIFGALLIVVWTFRERIVATIRPSRRH